MSVLIYLLFGYILLGEYAFNAIGLTAKPITLIPELLSMAAAVWVLFDYAFKKEIKVRLCYLIFFFAFVVHITIGLLGNQVQPLAVLAGLRIYFKFLPLFLLPMVCMPTDGQMHRHLLLLLGLALVQFPLTLYQRFIEYRGIASGDFIAGTLPAAPILTLFLLATATVLIAYYMKQRLRFNRLLILLFMVFLPTAINETKATVILLPLAILIPAFFEIRKDTRFKVATTVIPVGILMMAGFYYIYNTVYAGRANVVEFYTTGKASDYLYKASQLSKISGEYKTEVGRIDAMVLAYKKNADDFFKLVWGVGIGNAAPSFSKKFAGEYSAEYARLGGKISGISHLLWEIGLLGIAHILWLLLLILIDARGLRKQPGMAGALALGWIGVVILAVIALPYQNVITKNELVYPFFYLSGYLAAWAYRVQRGQAEPAEAAI